MAGESQSSEFQVDLFRTGGPQSDSAVSDSSNWLGCRQEQCPVGPWTYDMKADLPNQVKPDFLPAVEALLDQVARFAGSFQMLKLLSSVPSPQPQDHERLMYSRIDA